MKITKQSFSFGAKASHNYQSFEATQGFEVEYDTDKEEQLVEKFKESVKQNVMAEAVMGVFNLDKELKTAKDKPKSDFSAFKKGVK